MIAVMITMVAAIFGVVLGSFVNAFVWRLRILENPSEVKIKEVKKPSQVKNNVSSRAKSRDLLAQAIGANTPDYSILRGRSMCPNCKHTLAAKDLVPIFSWLALKGRCRYCREPISWQYPLVELLTGLLFAVSCAAWPHGLGAGKWLLLGLWLIFVVFFMALAVYDARWYELPDRVVYPLTILAALYVVVKAVSLHDWSILWSAIFAAAIIFGLFWLIFQVSQGRAIGGGDVKLAVTLGLLAGDPLNALLLIFLASFIGTLISLPAVLLAKRGVKALVPFGPFLLSAVFLVVLWGDTVFDSWLNKLLLP